MRDTNKDMIELLDASENSNLYSAVIRHRIADEDLKLRFAIEQADYGRLKRILEFRPFENTSVTPYRYFFALSYRQHSNNKDLMEASIRVEQLDRHKQYDFLVSKKILANILWFQSLTDKKEVEQMIEK